MTILEGILILSMAAFGLVPAWMWWDMRRECRASDEEGRALQAAFQAMLDKDSSVELEAWQRRYSR